MKKVIGIGWAKTGTTTLGVCLQQLGFNHCGHRRDLVDRWASGDHAAVIREADRYDSFEDWPWLLLYKELDVAYPAARFVLTHRDPESWWKSYRGMLDRQCEMSERLIRMRRFLYGLPFPDVSRETLIQRYERHNREVRAWFAGRPGKLLEVNWMRGDGWRELCEFLDCPIPTDPFPHANKGTYTD